MTTALDSALKELNSQFLDYCTKVEEHVHKGVQAFMTTDSTLIQDVIDTDKRIDSMEIAIEEECLRIMAVHQPVAKDLRLLVGILKMNNDLERIGDLAVNIAKKVSLFEYEDTSLEKEGTAFFLKEMNQKALHMLKQCLDSFTQQDANLARTVRSLDDDVDNLKNEMKVLVLNEMKKHPEKIHSLSGVLRTSYHLERIADLATNIAEDVIYLVEGDIIRHSRPE